MKKPNVVVFGGGSGLSALLRGLIDYPLNLTAVVSVADNGGSSGIIRDEFNIAPPGDIRKVIGSLCKKRTEWNRIFEYRFNDSNKPFNTHTVGNIVFTALSLANNNSIIKSVEIISKLLDISGEVIPVCDCPTNLVAVYDDCIIEGESQIGVHRGKIEKIYLKDFTLNEKVIDKIREADMIVYSSGSLYTSLLASLIHPTIIEEINNSSAIKVMVCNIMTQPGETYGFKASDHISTLSHYVGEKNIDVVLANNNYNVMPKVLKKYKKKSSDLVKLDEEKCQSFNIIIKGAPFIKIEKGFIRHDTKIIAMHIVRILLDVNINI